MKKTTVADAVTFVLQKYPEGLTAQEITRIIIEQDTYTFKTTTPESVVSQTIRKNCTGITTATSKQSDVKRFKLLTNKRYGLN